MGRQEGSCCSDMLQQHVTATKRCVVHAEATCIRVVKLGYVEGTKSQNLICTHMRMLRIYVSGIFAATRCKRRAPRSSTCWTQLDELHGTRRRDKIIAKLVLHNYKTISSHEGTCCCNISLKHVPATFSCVRTCCDFVPATRPCLMSPQCTLHKSFVAVTCRCNLTCNCCKL